MPAFKNANKLAFALLMIAFVVGQWAPVHIHLVDTHHGHDESHHHHDAFQHAHTLDTASQLDYAQHVLSAHVVDLSIELVSSKRDQQDNSPDYLFYSVVPTVNHSVGIALVLNYALIPPTENPPYSLNNPRAPPTVVA